MSARDSERFMRRAIRLSRGGFPSPNPRVGCVIVKNGKIVGEGFHEFAGGPHAEVVALRKVGKDAKGAIAYVTLEPCAHFGKTPPCSNALIEAGIRKVVVACKDPNPVAFGGAKKLTKAGIRIEFGLLEEEARKENEIWLEAMRLARPFVAAKSALGLDGRAALPHGESKWITGPAARKVGHRLRAEMGAVLVGRGTVEKDDPHLTARIPGVRNQPLRIVLDPSASLCGTEAMFREKGETIWVVANGKKTKPNQIEVRKDSDGLDLHSLLEILWKRGVTSLLVEGGPKTVGSFFRAGLVDRLDLFVAPKILGAGPSWIEGLEASKLHGAGSIQLQSPRVRRIGPDLWIQARLKR